MTVNADDLTAVPLFAALGELELQELASWFEAKQVSEGTTLIGEGASGYSFFILAEGSVLVTAEGREVATLNRGDFFGEMSLLGDGRRHATVTATSPARVLVLFGTEFRQLQHDQPEIAGRLEAAMRRRAAELG
jgi:CRP-like cAMP-binding protein